MVRRRCSCRPSEMETTMTARPIPRLVRLGAARRLTRAVNDATYLELNSPREYDIPPGE